MTLSTRMVKILEDKINTCFQSIGATNGTRMPKSTNNREPIAWEYWLANHLARYADKRQKEAEAAAIAEGLIFDKVKNPMPPGTNQVLFNGEVVSISIRVSDPQTQVNVTDLVAFLRKKGVKPALLDEAIEAATKEKRAAHRFDASLITNGV
jgi:hypothetical protein